MNRAADAMQWTQEGIQELIVAMSKSLEVSEDMRDHAEKSAKTSRTIALCSIGVAVASLAVAAATLISTIAVAWAA